MPQECDLSVLTPPRVPYSFRMHANILLLIFLSAKWQPQRKTSIPRSRSTPFDPLYDELFRSEVNLIWFYLWLVRFDNCVYFAVFVWWRNQCDHRIYHKRYGKVYYASARKGRSQRECYHVCFLNTVRIRYCSFSNQLLQGTHIIDDHAHHSVPIIIYESTIKSILRFAIGIPIVFQYCVLISSCSWQHNIGNYVKLYFEASHMTISLANPWTPLTFPYSSCSIKT